MARIDYTRLRYGQMVAAWAGRCSWAFIGGAIYGWCVRDPQMLALSACFSVVCSIIRVMATDMAARACSDDEP